MRGNFSQRWRKKTEEEEQRVDLKVRPAQGDLMITCDVIILITSVYD